MEGIEAFAGIIIFFLLLILGFFAGSFNEKKHFRSIKEREKQTLKLPVLSLKKVQYILDPNKGIEKAEMVTGSVVVGLDYFKLVAASLRNLVGGNVTSYESLVDRGRREAILRMKASAGNADLIANVRIETSTIGRGSGDKNVGCIEVLAYGTAIKYRY